MIARIHFHHELLWRSTNATQKQFIINATFALKSEPNSIYHTRNPEKSVIFSFTQFTCRFKTIYALRVHCKKQDERKCEICLQAFCKRSALKAHQDQGCERLLEESSHEPGAEETKPTFVDCIAEPVQCLNEQEIDASFVCEIIPKADEIGINDTENGDYADEENGSADDSHHATISTDYDAMPLETRRRRKVKGKTEGRKSKKGKRHERIQRIYEYDNAPDTNETNGICYSCYLCNRR